MRNLVKHGLLLISLTTVASLAACGNDKPPQEPSSMSTTGATAPTVTTTPPPMPESRPPMTETRPVDTSGMTTSTPPEPAMPATPTAKPMTDAEIVAVTSALNNGEVEMAQLAAKSATNPDVKNYAAMMITQHRDMEVKGRTLATKAKITPSENETSTMMKTEVSTVVSSLKTQKGKDFDKAYMESQVKAHRDALNTIDNKLLPNAQQADLKTHLNEARGHIATHLAKAEEIQQKLEQSTTTTPPTKPKK